MISIRSMRGGGHRVEGVRGADEEHVRTGRRAGRGSGRGSRKVLLGVEGLEQRARGVALVGGAHLIDLVDHEHRIAALRDLEPLHDLARQGADVGAAVALDLGLVSHTAHREAEEFLAQGPGDGACPRSSCLRPVRPHETDDRALRVLLELAYREVLDDPAP